MPVKWIEVHFDPKRAHLQLDCDSDAFSPYLELARKQLEDSEVPFDKVIELSITDAEAFNAQRERRSEVLDWVIGTLLVVFVVFAIIGVITVGRWIAT